MTAIIIPVKPPQSGKQRLASALNAKQRAALVLAMLQDVLCAAGALSSNHSVRVVTADASVQAVARECGVGVIHEQSVNGYNAAVSIGLESVARRYPEGVNVAIVPSDLPLITVDDFLALVAPTAVPSTTIRLAPSHDETGTNGLYLSTPMLLKPAFGPDSFHRYRKNSRRCGVTPEIIRSPTLAFDVDHPEDLTVLMERGIDNHTVRMLRHRLTGAKHLPRTTVPRTHSTL